MHFSVLGLSQNKESADSLVRLVEAVSAHLIEEDGISYRKVIGPATFLHNNTYLKCDTALWNVNTNMIDAVGNVEIIQENTRLASDILKYDIPANLAMFRGSLVELSDKEGNILNTNYLNYNTRDSVGTFYFGGSMKSNDGKIIRLVFPELTEERRRELSKQISKMGEDAKVEIRNIRRDANDKIKADKKNSVMTEDEAKQSDKLVQDLTDKYIKEIDNITAAKTKEIMEI